MEQAEKIEKELCYPILLKVGIGHILRGRLEEIDCSYSKLNDSYRIHIRFNTGLQMFYELLHDTLELKKTAFEVGQFLGGRFLEHYLNLKVKNYNKQYKIKDYE